MNLQQKKSAIEDKIQELIDLGNSLFQTDVVLSDVIYETLPRRWLGLAQTKDYKYYIKISVQAVEQKFDTVLSEIIPHEVAHLICFALYKLKNIKDFGHGALWKKVCRALGGNGMARFSEFVKTNKRPYRYVTNSGKDIFVTKKIHHNMQENFAVYRVDGERISAANFVPENQQKTNS